MITTLKLFYQNADPMVALYGAATPDGDGWQCNLPAAHVVDGDPSALPTEQQLPIATAAKLVRFTDSFQARLAPAKVPMRLGALVSEISADTGLPPADVRRVVVQMLGQLRAVVERGDHFNSALLRIRPRARGAVAADAPGGESAPPATAVLLPVPAQQPR